MSEVYWRKVGAKIAKRRNLLDLTQDEVAKYAGIPRSALSLIETGARKVDLREARQICAKLYIELNDIAY